MAFAIAVRPWRPHMNLVSLVKQYEASGVAFLAAQRALGQVRNKHDDLQMLLRAELRKIPNRKLLHVGSGMLYWLERNAKTGVEQLHSGRCETAEGLDADDHLEPLDADIAEAARFAAESDILGGGTPHVRPLDELKDDYRCDVDGFDELVWDGEISEVEPIVRGTTMTVGYVWDCLSVTSHEPLPKGCMSLREFRELYGLSEKTCDQVTAWVERFQPERGRGSAPATQPVPTVASGALDYRVSLPDDEPGGPIPLGRDSLSDYTPETNGQRAVS